MNSSNPARERNFGGAEALVARLQFESGPPSSSIDSDDWNAAYVLIFQQPRPICVQG
jgi:hypothetical protein